MVKKRKYKYTATVAEPEIVIKLKKEKRVFLCVGAHVIFSHAEKSKNR